ncbi:MAG: TRAP transporter substrate-binding protein [Clostridiales bacterium]|nr:TRAP transporter substrate-binding protein [Clostridiales bacterium]
MKGTKKVAAMIMATAMMATTVGMTASADAEVNLKYATVFTATGTQADGAQRLKEILEETSDGRMTLDLYAAGTLGDKVATMEGLQMGTIEMTECAATDLSAYSSIWSVFSLPYLWDSGEQAVNTLMDERVQEILNADAEANGFVIIAWTDMGSRSILNKSNAVYTPEDLNGLKVRCMEDTVLAATINAMGASATPLAWSDCYTALQQGTIDGVENSPAVILSSGMTEVAKYFSLTEQFIIPDPVFVSKVWFEGLSEENQEALLAAGEQFTEEWNESIWPEATETALGELEAAGVEINEVDKDSFVEATQSVVDDFLESADESQASLYELLMEVREDY